MAVVDIPGWERQTFPAEGSPHGWVQWKGTNVCMDVHCPCGQSTHIDDDFVYYVECGACGKRFMVNGHVELVPLTDEEAATITDAKVTDA